MKTPSCMGCGKCCDFGWTVDVLKVEKSQIPPGYLDYDPKTDCWTMKLVGKACIAFDLKTRTCGIYENRPVVCKAFEPGDLDCLEALADK